MSWWSSHPKGSFGNVIHFLYHICGLDVAELATIGGGKIEYWSKTIATHKTGPDGFPVFDFLDAPEDRYLQQKISMWRSDYEAGRAKAIQDFWRCNQVEVPHQNDQEAP